MNNKPVNCAIEVHHTALSPPAGRYYSVHIDVILIVHKLIKVGAFRNSWAYRSDRGWKGRRDDKKIIIIIDIRREGLETDQ